MQLLTLIFILALAASTLLQLWLAIRHIRHIDMNRGVVPADFSERISLESHQKAADYSIAKTRLGLSQIFVDVAVLLVMTLGGGIQFLSDLWQPLVSSQLWRGTALMLSVLFIMSALEIPLNFYRSFVIDARFGFNKQTMALFFSDIVKQAFLAIMLGLPLVLGVLWLMGVMGEHWWLYVWLTWMGFNLLVLAIYPTFIAPLFNKFTPLPDGELKQRIERLLQKCGFKAKGLFVMDGSKRSSHGNAYFTGFGKTKRIVFFDTLLQRLNPDEVEAVLAHELGHFKRRHVAKRMFWMFLVSLAGLWLLGYLLPQEWFYHGLGVTTQSNAAALLLFLMVSPVFTFLLHPLMSFYSRKHEFEADQYAAQTASETALVQALVKLYQDNAATLTPDPLHSAFYDSHPPAVIRIARLQDTAA